ncbi:MAG: maltose alpha-D-glucosyltransferase [Betaproteobacteria bacterium]|nr:MAG: maltose alpha-D-glucosyltransferase [Betaproteobacteria bacterium]
MNRRASADEDTAAIVAAADADDSLWYKDAIVYELHLKAFFDSNNDGIGDVAGLTEKLDYIRDLGVNTVWLLPFYPSPMKDDGYDVADYHNIHPAYGTRQDFRHFVREAHRRGLRIITELVVNHTSDQHPWFQAARRAPAGSVKRDYYVWSNDPRKYAGTRVIFTDTEKSNWTWDEVAQAHYWHRFFSHQPDLNFDNPRVLKAIFKTMQFWFDIGVDGFRLDAIPYLCEREGTSNENLPETHAVIKQIRKLIDERYRNRMLLAEANQWPEDVYDYFGNGDECHMAYHFPLMPRMYMAIAQEDRHPITEIMSQTPDIPDNCQWAIFLRNHDELTLEMVTKKERDYMYQMYAGDPRARLNLGIRRRLAPLLENDSEKIKLMNSLLFSMPGSPIIYYGDEIGMGDNVYLGDRDGVRTPMQWGPDRNAGFSTADPQRLYLPPIMDPLYGFQSVNVEAQARESTSLLNWMRRMLGARKTYKAFGRGTLAFLRPGNRKILAYLREYGDESVLCVANLARSAQPVELDLATYKSRVPVELMGRTPFPPIGDLPYLLTLPAYGFLWFKLTQKAEMPAWHEERLPRDELPVLVLFDGWESLFRDRVVPWRIGAAERVRARFEREVLPGYFALQRWYAAKGDVASRVALIDHVKWKVGGIDYLIALFRTEHKDAESQVYFAPLALAFDERETDRHRALQADAIAKVRQQADVGVVADALGDETFCHALVRAVGERGELSTVTGTLRFEPTAAYAGLAQADLDALKMRSLGARSTNSVVVLGDHWFLKIYRRLRPGINPEAEIGRFLTDVAHFPNVVPVAGTLEYVGSEGRFTLALLQAHVDNQGDGWNYTQNYLGQFFEQRSVNEPTAPPAAELHGGYLALVRTLGRRVAELHHALALTSGDQAFDPEPVDSREVANWSRQARHEAVTALDLLAKRRASLPATAERDVDAVLSRRAELLSRIDAAGTRERVGRKSRIHGDLHLAQVLLRQNDFVIIDFEGEPQKSIDERRAKHSPLKDVAGMLRSFNYAMHVAVDQACVNRPETRNALEAHGRAWEAEVRKTLLEAYRERIDIEASYGSAESAQSMLDLFTLEKACYELRYELGNRPDWVHVALRGVLESLSPPAAAALEEPALAATGK